MQHSTHCIHQLFPPVKFFFIKLHALLCVFSLPLRHCQYELYKRFFVPRTKPTDSICCTSILLLLTAYLLGVLCLGFPFILCFTITAFVCHMFHEVKGLFTYLLKSKHIVLQSFHYAASCELCCVASAREIVPTRHS